MKPSQLGPSKAATVPPEIRALLPESEQQNRAKLGPAQRDLPGGSGDRVEFRYSADHAQEGSVGSFDVRVFAIRRRPGRRVFEVRWRVAGGDKSRSFITRALADS